jgi:hypothetical protein
MYTEKRGRAQKIIQRKELTTVYNVRARVWWSRPMLQIATDPNPVFGVITQVPWKFLARQAVRG